MSQIRVDWKRTVQTQQYETLTLSLGVEETVEMPPITPNENQAIQRAATLASLQEKLAQKISEMGDKLVAKMLAAPDIPRKSKEPPASPAVSKKGPAKNDW